MDKYMDILIDKSIYKIFKCEGYLNNHDFELRLGTYQTTKYPFIFLSLLITTILYKIIFIFYSNVFLSLQLYLPKLPKRIT